MSAKKRSKLPQARPPARRSAGPSVRAITGVAVLAVVLVAVLVGYQQVAQRAPAPVLPSTTDFALGPGTAPVTVEEFADFQCPSCKAAQESTVHRLEADAVAPGSKFKFVYRFFPFIGPESQVMAEAATCAGSQGKFFPFADRLYAEQRPENSGYMTRARMVEYAAGLGLDQAKFTTCLDQGAGRSVIQADYSRGRSLQIPGTPTFLVNGQRLDGLPTYDVIKQAIDQAAAAAGSR